MTDKERYTYGWERTIHGSTAVNVERDPENGSVVSVWFRCQPLPFTDRVCDKTRAKEMRDMYKTIQLELYGVDIEASKPDKEETRDTGLRSHVTLSGNPAEEGIVGAPAPINPETGMHKDYWVLSEEDRAKGFVRPVRISYRHLRCNAITTMNQVIAETYAANPSYYGSTFCVKCKAHFPVGQDGEFVWAENPDQKVGT